MALITINGIEMPDPTTYNIPMSDMDASDSAYSESGVKIRNLVRANLTRIDLGWITSGDKAIIILSAIDPKDPEKRKAKVEYLDPRTGSKQSTYMLVEDRSCNLALYGDDEDPNSNLWEISFSLIENEKIEEEEA